LGLPGTDLFVGTPRVVLTVVAVNPSASGYLTIYSCGTRPTTSDLNYTKGVTIANTVTARPSATLALGYPICVYTSAATDLIIDVAGSLR
jgi:hypothetical protein